MKITTAWLKRHGAGFFKLRFFKKHFPEEEIDIMPALKKLQELGSFNSIIWLIENLPFNPKPLKLTDQNVGDIFYPGDVHIKNSCAVSGTVWIKGKLIINGQLILQKNAFVKGCVKAEQIELQKNSSISGFVETAQIELQKNSRIFGFVEADVIIHEKKRGTEPFKSVLFNYSGYANGKFIFWKK